MQTIAKSVKSRGGIAATYELLQTGHSPGAIFTAVRAGDVIRIRKGWYASTDTTRDVLQAWRVGGQLDCVSAAIHHALWVPELPEMLHVCVPAYATQLRRPDDHRRRLAGSPNGAVRIHWSGIPSGDRTAVTVLEAIIRIYHCQQEEVGFVVLESALHLGLLDAPDIHELLERIPGRTKRLARLAGRLSESGSESYVKLMLLRLGIPFRQQVFIRTVGRVDFVIGERLVIEVDSRQFHSDPYRDRRRDADLSVQGYRSLRFMYSQVVHEPERVEAAIISALARSDHNRA